MVQQELYHRAIAGARRSVERGSFRRVGSFRPACVGAALEQERRDRVVPGLHGRRQRPLAAGPLLANPAGILCEKRRHTTEVAEGRRNGKVRGGAAREQQPRRLDVAAAVPEERQIDGLEIRSRIAGIVTGACAVPRVNVGATVDEHADSIVRRCQHRAMEPRPALAIAELKEERVGVENPAQRRRIIRVRGQMDRMLRTGRGG